MSSPITVAAFDFDHTLLKGDSMRAFLRFYAGDRAFVRKLSKLSPFIFVFFGGGMSREKIKEIILKEFFAGKSREDLWTQGQRFAEEVLPRLERREAMDRLYWHQKQGHRCYLVTASMDIWTYAWAEKKGLKLIATRSAIDEKGVFWGKIQGTNNWGPGKVFNLKRELEGMNIDKIYAYGDSEGDRELLEMADFSYYRSFTD